MGGEVVSIADRMAQDGNSLKGSHDIFHDYTKEVEAVGTNKRRIDVLRLI